MKKNIYLIISIFLPAGCGDEPKKDCAGGAGGSAIIGYCNPSVEGETGLACCSEDCHGDFGG